jgi:beta-galactosidase/beta-glucuronidase
VPEANYVNDFKQWTSLDTLYINVSSLHQSAAVDVAVFDGETLVASASGLTGQNLAIPITNPILWSPSNPFLYNTTISLVGFETVSSYFGMRTFTLGKDQRNVTRPLLNGKFLFLSGFLDQGYVQHTGRQSIPVKQLQNYCLQPTI